MQQGKWNDNINSKYHECFNVDIAKICGKDKLQKPIVPVYRPWVRMYDIVDVKGEDIQKFH